MVLEQIITNSRLERTPSLILAISFIFVSLAMLLTHYFYPTDHGTIIILLTIMPAIPFFLNFIVSEEQRHEIEDGKRNYSLFKIYRPLFSLYFFFFIGTALSFALWASILPEGTSDWMFSDIHAEFLTLQSAMTGNLLAESSPMFMILRQNLLVLALMVLFSFIYSIGSILLLTWNAALLGIYIEHVVRAIAATPTVSSLGILSFPVAFIAGSFQALLSILPHGIFELSAFFVASLAGGILSVAFERGTYRRRPFWHIIRDACKLFILAIVLLVIGAAIESLYA